MIKSIITTITELKKQCKPVEPGEDVSGIIQDLKDTLETFSHRAIGLSANQIGYDKRISYIRMNKENAYILINPKIVEKDRLIKVKGESCLSFHGIGVETGRYVFCTVEYLDEHMQPQVKSLQDLEAICCQHELDHLSGLTIFDRRYKDPNHRK